GEVEPAIPETVRLAHSAISRRGKDSGADGAPPRRAGPGASQGGLGTGGRPAVAGSREIRRDVRRAGPSARTNRKERRVCQLPRLCLPRQVPVRLHPGGLPALSRRHRAGSHACPARVANGAAPATATGYASPVGLGGGSDESSAVVVVREDGIICCLFLGHFRHDILVTGS